MMDMMSPWTGRRLVKSFCGQNKEKLKDKVTKISKSTAGNGRQNGLALEKDTDLGDVTIVTQQGWLRALTVYYSKSI